MGKWYLGILSFLFVVISQAETCEFNLSIPQKSAILKHVESKKSGDYNVTLNESSQMLIVMSSYKPLLALELVELLEELQLTYEVLQFHGTEAVHIKFD